MWSNESMLSKKKLKKSRKDGLCAFNEESSYSGRNAYIRMLESNLYVIFLDDGSFFGASTNYFAAKTKIKEENMELVSLQ